MKNCIAFPFTFRTFNVQPENWPQSSSCCNQKGAFAEIIQSGQNG